MVQHPPPPFRGGKSTDSGSTLRAEVNWHKSGHVLHFGFKKSVLGPQHTFPLVAVLIRPILLLPFLVPFFCLVFTKKSFPLTLLLVCFALVPLLYMVFVAWCQYIRCTSMYMLFTVLVMKWGCDVAPDASSCW